MDLNDRENIFPYIRSMRDDVDPPNIVNLINNRQLGLKKKSALKQFAELKASVSEMKETHCQLPSSARSTFLMSFSYDCSKVASTHGDHNIYVSDMKTGKHIRTLEGHPRTPWCIAFHPTSNEILASGCLAGEVRIWDLHGGSERWRAEHDQVIASLTFHPTQPMLVIATGNCLYFWKWSEPSPAACCSTNSELERVRYVKFDNFGHRIITGISNLSSSGSGLHSNPFNDHCPYSRSQNPHFTHPHQNSRDSEDPNRTSRRSIMERLRSMPEYENNSDRQSTAGRSYTANRPDRPLASSRTHRSRPNRVDRPSEPLRAQTPSGTDRAERTSGTDRAERTSGTDRAERASRTYIAERASRTYIAERTSGTDRAERTSGTGRAEGPSGPDRAERTSGIDRPERTSGTGRTDRTSGTSRADRTPGTGRAEGFSGTDRVNRSTSRRPDSEPRPYRDDRSPVPSGAGRSATAVREGFQPANLQQYRMLFTESFTEEVRRLFEGWIAEEFGPLMFGNLSESNSAESPRVIRTPSDRNLNITVSLNGNTRTIPGRATTPVERNQRPRPYTSLVNSLPLFYGNNPEPSADHQNRSLSDHDYFSESDTAHSRVNTEERFNNSEPAVMRSRETYSEFFTSGDFWLTFDRLRGICSDLEQRLSRQAYLQRNDASEPRAGPSLNDGGSGISHSTELPIAPRNDGGEIELPNPYTPLINMLSRIRLALRFSTMSLTAVRDRIDQIRRRIRWIITRIRYLTGGRHVGRIHRDIFDEMTVQLTEQMDRLLQADERLANSMTLSQQSSAAAQATEQPSVARAQESQQSHATAQATEQPPVARAQESQQSPAASQATEQPPVASTQESQQSSAVVQAAEPHSVARVQDLELPVLTPSVPEEISSDSYQSTEQSYEMGNATFRYPSRPVSRSASESSSLPEDSVGLVSRYRLPRHRYNPLSHARTFRSNSQFGDQQELYGNRYQRERFSSTETIDVESEVDPVEVISSPSEMLGNVPSSATTTDVPPSHRTMGVLAPVTTHISFVPVSGEDSMPSARNYTPHSRNIDLYPHRNDDDNRPDLSGVENENEDLPGVDGVRDEGIEVSPAEVTTPEVEEIEDISDTDDDIFTAIFSNELHSHDHEETSSAQAAIDSSEMEEILDISDTELDITGLEEGIRHHSPGYRPYYPRASDIELFIASGSGVEPPRFRLSSFMDPPLFEPISDASSDDSDRPITPPLLMYSPTYNSLLFNGNSRIALNDPLTQNHRIQVWDFKGGLPPIYDATANVVVRRCMIHNDASVDISQDGEKLVALIPPEDRDPSNNLMFGIFSLKPTQLGRTLCLWGYISNAISVSFSPLAQYVVVGSAYSRPIYSNPEKAAVAQIIKINKNKDAYDASYIRSFTQVINNENRFQQVSLNCVKWLPQSGLGIAYATNRGCLCICKPIAGEMFENIRNEPAPVLERNDRGERFRIFRAFLRQ